jgi:hypothetical protein
MTPTFILEKYDSVLSHALVQEQESEEEELSINCRHYSQVSRQSLKQLALSALHPTRK